MTKKKTALQILKERLEGHCYRRNPLIKGDIIDWEDVEKEINILLPTEREQIEYAYNIGMDDMGRGEFGSNPEHKDALDYFAQNYETE